MSSSKLRGVLDERTHRIREEDEEDQRDALKSFVRSETSADREERELSFCSTREQQREQQSEKKREIFERKARGFKRDQIASSNLFRRFFLFSWRGGRRSRRGFFCSKFEKKTLEAKKEERKRKRKRNIIAYEKAPREDLTVSRAAAKVAFVSRTFVSRRVVVYE